MAVIPLANNAVVNVQMFGRLAAQQIITLFQYQFRGNTDQTTDYFTYLDSLASKLAVALNLEARFLDCLPTNYAYDTLRLQPVWPVRIRFKDYAKAGGGSGPNFGSTANIATSIERFGRAGGRRGIGRVQLPLCDGAYGGGLVNDPVLVPNLAIMAVQMASSVIVTGAGVAGTWDPVIHNVANPQPLTVLVEACKPQKTVRTMHRRTVGLGK